MVHKLLVSGCQSWRRIIETYTRTSRSPAISEVHGHVLWRAWLPGELYMYWVSYYCRNSQFDETEWQICSKLRFMVFQVNSWLKIFVTTGTWRMAMYQCLVRMMLSFTGSCRKPWISWDSQKRSSLVSWIKTSFLLIRLLQLLCALDFTLACNYVKEITLKYFLTDAPSDRFRFLMSVIICCFISK